MNVRVRGFLICEDVFAGCHNFKECLGVKRIVLGFWSEGVSGCL